eukprot:295883_1
MSDWIAVRDPKSGQTYYANTKTRQTSWNRPPAFDGVVQPQMAHNQQLQHNTHQQQYQYQYQHQQQYQHPQMIYNRQLQQNNQQKRVFHEQHQQYTEQKLNVVDEKDDTDNEIDDEYENVRKHELLASSEKRSRQDGANYEVANLKTVKRNGQIDTIKKCIGQIMISYDGSNDYFYGTGTVYKVLNAKYCLIITCAHNL